jgi:hypothetical protein
MKRIALLVLALALAAPQMIVAQPPPSGVRPPGQRPQPPQGLRTQPPQGDQGPGRRGNGPRENIRRPGGLPEGYGSGSAYSSVPRPSELERMAEDDPEMHKLVMEDMRLEEASLDLANQFRTATPENREKLRADLAVQVHKHFDVRQQRRELQLKRLEDELKRLREAIESRTRTRDEIVQKRLIDLVGDPKDLEF